MPQHFIQDYITELSYVSNYYSDLTPKHLSFVAAINNFQPPDIFRPFAYCELGCGCGKTTNTVAACYPKANCIGVDINSDHIKIAKNESSGLSNIHFFDVSFKDALHLDLIKFDFIVMHGVWSWVNDSVRSDILKFVKKFLKTKGLFYISYDSMPGWTQLQPFHKIMSLYTKNMQCPLEEKAKSAMAYLQYLHINKSPFFERNPDAKCFLQLLERSDIRYIVHELFNEHLRPDYFCDVAAKMQNAGLSFVGNNSYIDNYYTILPEPFKELLGTANDRISLETHKSIIQNDRFRKDLYTKSKPSLDCEKNYLRNFIFGASKSIHDLRLKVDFSGYSVTLAANPYLTIFQLLSEKQLTIKELNKKLKRSPQKIAETIENIINCMLTNQFVIFMQKASVKSIEKEFVFTNKYNENQVLNWKDQYSKQIYLASKAAGDAIAISKKHALILAAMYQFGISKEVVIEHVYRFICEDMKKENNIFRFSVDQNIKELISIDYEEVSTNVLGNLSWLGIVSPR